MNRRLATLAALTGALILLSAAPAIAEDPVNASRGIAIKGYDPVAYFTENKPVKGDKAFSHEWNGATWLFANDENRDTFAADPEKHAPAYGGWCAYAVAHGYTAKIDPRAFTVLDGRLFLNYSPGIQKKWNADRAQFIAQADDNWPRVLD